MGRLVNNRRYDRVGEQRSTTTHRQPTNRRLGGVSPMGGGRRRTRVREVDDDDTVSSTAKRQYRNFMSLLHETRLVEKKATADDGQDDEETRLRDLRAKLGFRGKDTGRLTRRMWKQDGLEDLLDVLDPKDGDDDDELVGMGNDVSSATDYPSVESKATTTTGKPVGKKRSSSDIYGVDRETDDDRAADKTALLGRPEPSPSTLGEPRGTERPAVDSGESSDKKVTARSYAPTRSADAELMKRRIRGWLNRLSETHLEWVYDQLEGVYTTGKRHDVLDHITRVILDTCTDTRHLLDSFMTSYAALVALMYHVIGIETGAYFVEIWAKEFDTCYRQSLDADASAIGKQCRNRLLLLVHLYQFQVVSCVPVYDLIRRCLRDLSESTIELILTVIQRRQIRQDDPSALRDIAKEMRDVVSQSPLHERSRVVFMVETIEALSGTARRHPHAKGIVDSLTTDEVADWKKRIRALVQKRTSSSTLRDPLRVPFDDYLEVDVRGRWWLVGSAWAGRDANPPSTRHRGTDDDGSRRRSVLDDEGGVHADKLEMAARRLQLNTEVRRRIFAMLLTSEDYVQAFEALVRFDATEKQDRETIRVLVHCCGHERVYNRFYAYLAEKLCRHAHAYRVTFRFCYWDFWKTIDQVTTRHVIHLARLLVHLIRVQVLTLDLVRVVDFTRLTRHGVLFFQSLFSAILVADTDHDVLRLFRPICLDASLAEGCLFFVQHHMRHQDVFLVGDDTSDQARQRLARRSALVRDCLESGGGADSSIPHRSHGFT